MNAQELLYAATQKALNLVIITVPDAKTYGMLIFLGINTGCMMSLILHIINQIYHFVHFSKYVAKANEISLTTCGSNPR